MAFLTQDVLGIVAASFVSVLTLLLIRGVIKDSKRQQKRRICKQSKETKHITADAEVLRRFSKAIQCETVSWSQDKSSHEELLKLHALIKEGKSKHFSNGYL